MWMFSERGSFPISTQNYLLASSIDFNLLPFFCQKLRKLGALAENTHLVSRSRLSSVGVQSRLSPTPSFLPVPAVAARPLLLPYHRWPPIGGAGAVGPVRAPSQPEPLLSFLPASCCQKDLNSWWLPVSVPAHFLFFPISLAQTPSPISNSPSFPISAQVTWEHPSLPCLGLEV